MMTLNERARQLIADTQTGNDTYDVYATRARTLLDEIADTGAKLEPVLSLRLARVLIDAAVRDHDTLKAGR